MINVIGITLIIINNNRGFNKLTEVRGINNHNKLILHKSNNRLKHRDYSNNNIDKDYSSDKKEEKKMMRTRRKMKKMKKRNSLSTSQQAVKRKKNRIMITITQRKSS